MHEAVPGMQKGPALGATPQKRGFRSRTPLQHELHPASSSALHPVADECMQHIHKKYSCSHAFSDLCRSPAVALTGERCRIGANGAVRVDNVDIDVRGNLSNAKER
eukprot:scaffold57314_cov19-Tisochrysis_lutea.AAC.1